MNSPSTIPACPTNSCVNFGKPLTPCCGSGCDVVQCGLCGFDAETGQLEKVFHCAHSKEQICEAHVEQCPICKQLISSGYRVGKTCAYCIASQMQNADYEQGLLDQLKKCVQDREQIAQAVDTVTKVTARPPTGDNCAECKLIYQAFYPPLVTIHYGDASDYRESNPLYAFHQAEHFIPNSCFLSGTRSSKTPMQGAPNYSEAKAPTYLIYDDQTQGTEHKHLTDKERDACQSAENQATFGTLEQWLNKMQAECASMLVDQLYRQGHRYVKQGVEAPRPRVLPFGVDPGKLAVAAAQCVRWEMERVYVDELKIPMTTLLRNGLVPNAKAPGKSATGTSNPF